MSSQSTPVDDQTARRRPWVGALLTFVCPGLGYIYTGKLVRGLALNLGFVVTLVAFVALATILEFFPLTPLVVLGAGWLLFTALLAYDVYQIADEQGAAYEPRGYNHWTMYGGLYLLTFLLPITAVGMFTHRFLWDVQTVRTDAMYPNVHEGDTVLIRKDAFDDRPLRRGELVAVRSKRAGDYRLMRIVALPGETVSMWGNDLTIEDETVPRTYFEMPEKTADDLVQREALSARDISLRMEANNGENYVVSYAPEGQFAPNVDSVTLEEQEFFLLADNRTHYDPDSGDTIRDSRNFGPVTRKQIAGKPLFVVWSRRPDGADNRWDRIGLKLQ